MAPIKKYAYMYASVIKEVLLCAVEIYNFFFVFAETALQRFNEFISIKTTHMYKTIAYLI